MSKFPVQAGGAEGANIFSVFVAFSGLSFVPTALQKETRSLGRWEKTAIMAL